MRSFNPKPSYQFMRFKRGIRSFWPFYFLILVSCGENRADHVSDLSNNLEKLESLRHTIESRYSNVLSDSLDTRNRIVFTECDEEDKLSKDYFCDDRVILETMKELELQEVRFEKKGSACIKGNMYNEVYFQPKKISNATVYYMYEYCGTVKTFESETIFYNPLDSNWSVYVDSSYP